MSRIFLSVFSGFLSVIMLVAPFSPVNRINKKDEEAENRMEIKVATYNIRNGGDVNHDFQIIANDILENEFEIVGIQEVDHRTNRNGRQQTMKVLSELTGYEYYEFTRTIDYDGGGYGTGILSKYPIDEYETIILPSDVHEQRKLGHAVINVNGVTVDFFNTHLSWESIETRTKQFEKISEETAKCENFIVTGDFNTHDFTEYNVIKNSSIVNNESSKMNSCGEDGAIDNIVYSKSFKVEKYGMVDIDHSDHKPVWAVLSIEAPDTAE